MDVRGEDGLRRGWTTGACATAATKGALEGLWTGRVPATATITLPRGETPTFALVGSRVGPGWAEAGVVKDAGDDPDVTHGATIRAHVREGGGGVTFAAGDGVGTVTRAGLPIPPGEPAINPAPRAMMRAIVAELAASHDRSGDVTITISVPGGAALAEKTWNGRLGIAGGLSILGTTGVVRPFSCAAWIASIKRGVDVARAAGEPHLGACTGATSERVVQALYGLPDHAMIDMGDFAGGTLGYVARHPVARLTVGGGIGKIVKLSQGAMDLHSARSQVDIPALVALARDQGLADIADAATAQEAVMRAGPALAESVAVRAHAQAGAMLAGSGVVADIVVIDRGGAILARAGPAADA